MATQRIQQKTLEELKDRDIGKVGTPERDRYEFDLKVEILGEMIKTLRKDQQMTQEQLGQLVGVQKAQISRLERNTKNVTVGTILKVFAALRAKVRLSIEREPGDIRMV